MLKSLNHPRLLRYAGLFTWAMVGLPLVYSQYVPATNHEQTTMSPHAVEFLFASYLLFGGCYFWVSRELQDMVASWWDRVLLLLLTISALAVSYFNGSGLGSVLLMVAAGVIPWLLPTFLGGIWLLLSQLPVIHIYIVAFEMPPFEAVMQSLLYSGFSMFIFVTSLVAKQQTQAHIQQGRLNAELHATRALLAESARVNERIRISRELHDLLGHHLTALSLNLEVASHITEGRAQEHIKQSHTLAKLLLTDVREVVSQLRDSGSIDLAAALLPLAERTLGLPIKMDIAPNLFLDDPERAHVLLRCTQEIITNTMRHAGARHLWIKVWREDLNIIMEAKDDGRGSDKVHPGNGLRGMYERVQQCSGTLDIQTELGNGFHLRLAIPITSPFRLGET